MLIYLKCNCQSTCCPHSASRTPTLSVRSSPNSGRPFAFAVQIALWKKMVTVTASLGHYVFASKGWFEPFHLRSLIPRHTMIGTVIYSMVDSMLSSLWNITGLPKFTLRHVASQRSRRRRRHGRPWKTWTYGTESNSFDQNSGDRINQIRAAFSYGIGRIGIPIPWDS